MSVGYDDPTYLESVYAALFALLKNAQFPNGIAFKKASRMMSVPEQIDATQQPMLILYQGPMNFSQKEVLGPVKNEFSAIAVILVRADGLGASNETIATTVNYIIWGIKKAFDTRPPYQKQTLGGIVYHCWIEGDVVPEYLDQQVIIAVPIKILPN